MNSLNDLTVLFISIILESLSFLLLGACIASLIGIFIMSTAWPDDYNKIVFGTTKPLAATLYLLFLQPPSH